MDKDITFRIATVVSWIFCGALIHVSAATTSLVGYYPFDGDANDFSGHRNHGVIYGAQLTADRFGKPASAYQFDGKSYVEMRQLPDAASMSFSVWITSPQPGYGQNIFFEGNSADGHDFALASSSISGTDGPRLDFATKDNTTLSYPYGKRDSSFWVHIVGVADAVHGRKELWVDGVRVAASSFKGSANNSYHYKLEIGRAADGRSVGSYFVGKIDDLRFYSQALTADDIATLRLELRVTPGLVISEGTLTKAAQISFQTDKGKVYALESTADFEAWVQRGVITGTGAMISLSVPVSKNAEAFRLRWVQD